MEGVGAPSPSPPFMILDAVIIAVLLTTHITIFGYYQQLHLFKCLHYFTFYLAPIDLENLPRIARKCDEVILYPIHAYVVIGFIDLLAAGFIGDGWLIIQAVLVLLLARSCLQRRRALNDPRFRSWWTITTGEDVLGIELSEGEVLATCPSCSSMLAVIPVSLARAILAQSVVSL